MNCIDEVVDILDLLYKHGWDERNGGNLSYIVSKEQVEMISDPNHVSRTFSYKFDLAPLIGRYFVITGTGKYFKNAIKEPQVTLGIVKVLDSHTLGLVWGFEDGGRPTSEAPTHLKCHIERLAIDPNHRVVMHCHPDHVIAMTHVHTLDENAWARDLWKMQTESIVVFPEGIGILPWILCGGEEIGEATAYKMKQYRSVVWAQHGLFATGSSIDETFGLIETIEKAAKIYMTILGHPIIQSISDEQLKLLADTFHVAYKKGVID